MKKKERYIKEGLRYRIKLFSAILAIKGKKPVDVENVTITITRNLPKNLVELAQVIGNLQGICSNETLVAQLPFVEDPEKEVEKAAEEKRQAQDEQFVMDTWDNWRKQTDDYMNRDFERQLRAIKLAEKGKQAFEMAEKALAQNEIKNDTE